MIIRECEKGRSVEKRSGVENVDLGNGYIGYIYLWKFVEFFI